ncbi:MAG: thiamine ABC transporter substrate binding subunit [Alphaproteobacteria bacterium]|jgi:thiamine transport system substrate-binding protein|nr:thiamine ABC transporter substrate binding subunit [Alphaproteobacteria bacterium]
MRPKPTGRNASLIDRSQAVRLPLAVAAVALAGIAAPAAAQERPTLTVYTYDSFVSDWGPGPQVEEAFEATCGCDLDFVSVEDGVSILSRLRLEGGSTDADVVLGLDTNLIAEARALDLLAPHGIDDLGARLDNLPIAWDDPVFVPFDWGYFAFVYDTEAIAAPPASLDALVNDSEAEILIQDPRTSTPGLGLLLWMKSVFGADAEAAWETLRPRIVTVSSGWSEAYGLFLEGEAPMVLSYTTSPAYHRIAEGTDRYAAAAFEEGHYLQIEVAATVATTDQGDLAERFLAFLTGPEVQGVIPTTNWMYPVVTPEGGLPEGFDTVVEPDQALLFEPEVVAENRRDWIDAWLSAMSR